MSLGVCAVALSDVAPEHDTIMLLGPSQAGKVRVVLGMVAALAYSTEPETHTFTLDDREFLLASHVGFLRADDELYLRLYRKDGHVYRDIGPKLIATADTNTFAREGFSLERRGADVSIVYLGSDSETVRVRIPVER